MGVASPLKGEGDSEDMLGQRRHANIRTPLPRPLRRGEATKFRLVTLFVLVLVSVGWFRAVATPFSADYDCQCSRSIIETLVELSEQRDQKIVQRKIVVHLDPTYSSARKICSRQSRSDTTVIF